jgi:type I restriction enzyme S subunit
MPLDRPDEKFDHYSIPAYDEGQWPIREPGGAIKSQKTIMFSDCVLLSKLNPRIPRVWMPELDASLRSVCSTEFLVLQAREPACRPFLFCVLKSRSFIDSFVARVTGTSGSHQRVKAEDSLSVPVVVPNSGVVQSFCAVVGPMFNRIANTLAECQTLVQLRNLLLPKLVSGEIRLKDAEKQAEAVL